VDFEYSSGVPSPAETYILYLLADGDTPRGDDFALWQRVNSATPELLARNLLPATGSKPWFEFLMQRELASGDTLVVASGGLLPLIRKRTSEALTAADTANYSRPDSVRAIRMNYRITNGKSGTEERIKEITTTIEVPNNGVPLGSVCGRPPIAPGSLTLTEVGTGTGELQVEWTRSSDQDGGEVDVRQYFLWRRESTEPAFTAPLLSVRAEAGTVTYTTTITDNIPGTTYVYGIDAQDCTPTFSSRVTSSVTMSTP
ncbi:MAG TPA: hypothetical protein PLL69_02760, partial [Gemmatimonadales bacterium]|nr:hypothetical protein [Gemmatimonadales bacterium]